MHNALKTQVSDWGSIPSKRWPKRPHSRAHESFKKMGICIWVSPGTHEDCSAAAMDRRRQAYFQGMGYILRLRIKIKIHFKSDSFASVYIIWEKNNIENMEWKLKSYNSFWFYYRNLLFIISLEDCFKWLALIKPLKCHSHFTSVGFLSTF